MASLALGVGAIATVQSVSSSIATGLRNDGRAILGGDVAIRTMQGPLPDEALAYLYDNSAAMMHYVETRAMARRDDGNSNTLIEFKAIDDNYPLFGELILAGSDVFDHRLLGKRERWGAVVEPLLLQRLGTTVGALIKIGDTQYEIRAVIEREPDRAGSGGAFGFAPRVLVDAASLPDAGLLQQGSMARYRYRLKLPDVAVDDFRTALEERFPDALWRIRDYRRPAERIERLLDRLTLFFTMVGLTTLLVGGVGVSNAVKAYMQGKIRSVAMLKCIGGTGDTLFATYTLQVLMLAVGGTALGLLFGAAAPWLVAAFLDDNVPVPFVADFYPQALAIAAGFGVLTAVAFSAWPLARTHEISPAALFRGDQGTGGTRMRPLPLALIVGSTLGLIALTVGSTDNRIFATWFIVGSVAVIALLQSTAWLIIRYLPRLKPASNPGVRLAIANMHRPGTLTPDVVLSLGLGLTVLVAVALVQGNLNRQISDSLPDLAPSFFFIDIQSHQIDEFEQTVRDIPGSGEFRRVPFLRGRILDINGQSPESLLTDDRYGWLIQGDRGLTYAVHPPDNAEIVAGEWWPEDYAGPPLLSIHKDVAAAFALSPGDTITLNVLGRKISGKVANVRDLPWRSMQVNFAIMFSPEPLRRAPHAFLATLGAREEAEAEIQQRIAESFPNVTTIRIKDALATIDKLVSRIGTAIRGVASIALIAGTLVLGGAVAAGHRRRVYESVLLKVFGATRRDAWQGYLIEYSLLGLLTAAIATIAGTLAAWGVITVLMQGDWQFVPAAAFGTAALCTAITLLLGFVGTWRALGRKAAPLLRNQ